MFYDLRKKEVNRNVVLYGSICTSTWQNIYAVPNTLFSLLVGFGCRFSVFPFEAFFFLPFTGISWTPIKRIHRYTSHPYTHYNKMKTLNHIHTLTHTFILSILFHCSSLAVRTSLYWRCFCRCCYCCQFTSKYVLFWTAIRSRRHISWY